MTTYKIFVKLLGEDRVEALRKAFCKSRRRSLKNLKIQEEYETWLVSYMEEGLDDYMSGLEEDYEVEEE